MSTNVLLCMGCTVTLSLLGVIARDLSHVLLYASSQGVTSALSVSLGLHNKYKASRHDRAEGGSATTQAAPTFAASASASPSVRCCLPACNKFDYKPVTSPRVREPIVKVPSAAHWSDTRPPTFSLIDPAVDLALPPACTECVRSSRT